MLLVLNILCTFISVDTRSFADLLWIEAIILRFIGPIEQISSRAQYKEERVKVHLPKYRVLKKSSLTCENLLHAWSTAHHLYLALATTKKGFARDKLHANASV